MTNPVHLAEFGLVAPVGRNGVEQLLGIVTDGSDKRLPEIARACVAALGAQLQMLKAQILRFDRMIMAWHRSSEASRRLDDIPGVGPALVGQWHNGGAEAVLLAERCREDAIRAGIDLVDLQRAAKGNLVKNMLDALCAAEIRDK